MPLDGCARCVGRLEMRRAHEHRHSILPKALEHRHGDLDRRRAIVDTRQQMRMDIDHARAATVSAPSSARSTLFECTADHHDIRARIARRTHGIRAADPAAHEQRPAPRSARALNHRSAHRARRAAARVEIRGVHPDERRCAQMRCRDFRLVRGQRARLAHTLHRSDVPSVHQAVRGADRLHFRMPLEERHGAHVLLDEVLRIAPRDEREQEHCVDVRHRAATPSPGTARAAARAPRA